VYYRKGDQEIKGGAINHKFGVYVTEMDTSHENRDILMSYIFKETLRRQFQPYLDWYCQDFASTRYESKPVGWSPLYPCEPDPDTISEEVSEPSDDDEPIDMSYLPSVPRYDGDDSE